MSKFEEIYKKVLDADKKFKKLGIPINLEIKIEDFRDALIESNDRIEELKSIRKRLEDANAKLEKQNYDAEKAVKCIYERMDSLEKRISYLTRLALHALSGWAIGMSMANAYLSKGSRGKQIKYYMVFEKFENLHNIEKNKWRKEKAESYK